MNWRRRGRSWVGGFAGLQVQWINEKWQDITIAKDLIGVNTRQRRLRSWEIKFEIMRDGVPAEALGGRESGVHLNEISFF